MTNVPEPANPQLPPPNVVKCITINTDASFHHGFKVSGYAYYIKSDLFTFTGGGNFNKMKPKNSEEAEIMAIGNALHRLLKMENLPLSKWLVVNSDSMFGMNKIRKASTPLGVMVSDMFIELGKRLHCKHSELRHVKSHSGVNDARSWVNEFCDKEAKKYMKLEARRIKRSKKYRNR